MNPYRYYLQLCIYLLAAIGTPHTMHAATEIEHAIDLSRLITECDADTFHEQLAVYQQKSTWQNYRQTTAQLKELALQLTAQKQEKIKRRLHKIGKRVFSGFAGIAMLIFVAGLSREFIDRIAHIKRILHDIYNPQPRKNAVDIQSAWEPLEPSNIDGTRMVVVKQETRSSPPTPAQIVRLTAVEQLLTNCGIASMLLSIGYKAVLDLHYAWYANTQKLTQEIKSLHTIIEDLQC